MLKEAMTSVKRCVAPAGSAKKIHASSGSGAVGSDSMTFTGRPRLLMRSTSVRHCTEPAPKTLPTTGTITVALGGSAATGGSGACANATFAARSTAAMSEIRGIVRPSNKVWSENPPQNHNDLLDARQRHPVSQDGQ